MLMMAPSWGVYSSYDKETKDYMRAKEIPSAIYRAQKSWLELQIKKVMARFIIKCNLTENNKQLKYRLDILGDFPYCLSFY